MNLARRVQDLPPYLFADISRKIAAKRAEGVDVISFAIGDPDLPTPPHILKALHEASKDPENHRYPESDGLPDYRRAVASWYRQRFGLTFDSDKEVLPLIGSKEGLGHIPLCFIDPGVRKTLVKDDFHVTDYSPWEGWTVAGWPVTTLLRGKVIVDRGKLVGTTSDGRQLRRKIDPVMLRRPAC